MQAKEQDFFKQLTKVLPKDQQRAIQAAIDVRLNEAGASFTEALLEELSELDHSQHWLLMEVDWKAVDEIAWQANAMANTHGLDGEFKLDGEENVDEALDAYSDWLAVRGFVFIQLQDNSDTYYGFIYRKNRSKPFVEVALEAGLPLVILPGRDKIKRSFGFSRKKRSDGLFNEILADTYAKASKKGQRVILYFTLPQCEPCQIFERLLDHPRMNEVLKDTWILRFDAMLWGSSFRQNGIEISAVPAFTVLTKNGELSQLLLRHDDIWDESTLRQITEFFPRFLADPACDKPRVMTRAQLNKALPAAVINGDMACVSRLVNEKSIDVTGPEQVGSHLLHDALTFDSEGSLPIIRMLIEQGYPINEQDRQGDTAFHKAVGYRRAPQAQYLFEHGADPNITNNNGEDVLHLALRHSSFLPELLITALIEASDDINRRDRNGITAIHIAVDGDTQRWMPQLIVAGANPNVSGDWGRTALHVAARYFRREEAHNMLQVLLAAGGDPDKEDSKGITPRKMIEEKDGPEVAKRLFQKQV